MSKKGFTLLEILIAIILISLLLYFGAKINLGGTVDRAKIEKTIQTIKKLSIAIKNYNEDTGYFPSTAKQLWKNDLSVEGWQGPYVKPPFMDYTYNYFPKMPYGGSAYIECQDGNYLALKMKMSPAYCEELDKEIDDGDTTKGRVYYDTKQKACYYLFDKGSYVACK
jgi:prepilin-type N-terminal cleavage/methylation domain-containing protein